MTLTDFLLARIADQIALAREVQAQGVTEGLSPDDPRSAALRLAALSLAECEAKRRIVELHKAWPVLVERPPTMEAVDSGDPTRLAYRMSRQIQWQTEHEYRERFGHEPPTAPILRALALPYADHPDYREEWRP